MEGAHGELGARLADGLGGDDADRLTGVDDGAAREVAAIAMATDADLGIASEDGADFDGFDAGFLDFFGFRLLDKDVGADDLGPGDRVEHRGSGGAAEHTLGEGGDDLAAIHHRAHGQATLGAAILLDDDAILRDIHQAAS